MNAARPQSAGDRSKKKRRQGQADGVFVVSYQDDMSSKFTHSPMQKVGPGPTKFTTNDREGQIVGGPQSFERGRIASTIHLSGDISQRRLDPRQAALDVKAREPSQIDKFFESSHSRKKEQTSRDNQQQITIVKQDKTEITSPNSSIIEK